MAWILLSRQRTKSGKGFSKPFWVPRTAVYSLSFNFALPKPSGYWSWSRFKTSSTS